MNFKRNLILITSALVGALSLTSCIFDSKDTFKRFEFIEANNEHKAIEGDGFIKYADYSSYKVKTPTGTAELGSAYDVIKNYGGEAHIPSTGDQNIIVIPVDFTDYGVEKLNLTKEQYIENLNNSFFGVAKNNAFVSVSEYYNRSSYGRLRLKGKVCDKFYTFPYSIQDIKDNNIKREAIAKNYENVLKWYKENYNDIGEYTISGLKEGKNVPIYMVYTLPADETSEDSETIFWAYTFNDIPLSWSSSSFMYLNYGKPDAHTFIHETGHLLGLNDYYPTIASKDKEKPYPDPAGRIDMMDCSVGDQTSFSKMMLNWARPYHVKDSCEITINPFSETGDLILLANSWNNTVFEEYYLLEFYTPTLLNTYDVSFGNSEAKLPTVPGIKLYHVDARLAYVDSFKKPQNYCDEVETVLALNTINLAHDNNTYEEPNRFQKNYLYSLILNKTGEMVSGCATNENLYHIHDTIEGLKLNSGEEVKYKLSIEKLQFNETTIKIEKTA